MKAPDGCIVLMTGSCLLAQTSSTGFGRQINPSGIPPGNWGAGFGRMIYPGTGGPPAAVRPGTPGAPARSGGRGGRGPVVAPPPIAHQGHANGAIVAYPVYYGGYYYPYDAPAAPVAGLTNYDPNYDPNSGGQPSPVVIINQSYRPDVINPVVSDYSNTQLPQYIPPPQAPAPQPTVSGARTAKRESGAQSKCIVDFFNRDEGPHHLSGGGVLGGGRYSELHDRAGSAESHQSRAGGSGVFEAVEQGAKRGFRASGSATGGEVGRQQQEGKGADLGSLGGRR